MTESGCPDANHPDGFRLCLCQKRAFFLLLFFALWGLAIFLRMGQIMVWQRNRHLSEISHKVWHRGMIPAQRGRILDASGLPLAWSVRRLRFEWRVPDDAELAERQWRALLAVEDVFSASPQIDDYNRFRGATVVLTEDLPGDAATAAASLTRKFPEFHLVPYFVRLRSGPLALRRALGSVIQRNGMEIGIDGYEKTHDGLLRGRPGIFRVMVDNQGTWIMDTWEMVQEIQTGYDVILPVTRSAP